ncbi:MAG: hypothetical protein ACREA4_13805 [Nitrososphaera sp.]
MARFWEGTAKQMTLPRKPGRKHLKASPEGAEQESPGRKPWELMQQEAKP